MPKVADLLEKIVILPTYSSGNDVVPPVLLKETEGVYYSVHFCKKLISDLHSCSDSQPSITTFLSTDLPHMAASLLFLFCTSCVRNHPQRS